jgi:hypothetical protein
MNSDSFNNDMNSIEKSVNTNRIVYDTNNSTSIESSFITKNMIIVILTILLILSFLGVNIFRNITIRLYNITIRILSMFGFYTGAIINTTADIVGDTTKGSIDIAEGTIHSIGNLLQNENNLDGKDASGMNEWNWNIFNMNPIQNETNIIDAPISVSVSPKKSLDSELNNKSTQEKEFSPINSNKEQNELSWCPVDTGKCIQTSGTNKCMFGKVFGTQSECENDKSGISFKTASQERSVNWGIPPPPPPPSALTPSYIPQMFNEIPGQTCGMNKHYNSFGRYGQPIKYTQSILTPPVKCINPTQPAQLLPIQTVHTDRKTTFDDSKPPVPKKNLNDYNDNYLNSNKLKEPSSDSPSKSYDPLPVPSYSSSPSDPLPSSSSSDPLPSSSSSDPSSSSSSSVPSSSSSSSSSDPLPSSSSSDHLPSSSSSSSSSVPSSSGFTSSSPSVSSSFSFSEVSEINSNDEDLLKTSKTSFTQGISTSQSINGSKIIQQSSPIAEGQSFHMVLPS